MDNAQRTAKRRTFYTAGYHQSRDELPAQAVNIACRPSERWRQEGTGRSLGCLYPNRAVWAASKSGGELGRLPPLQKAIIEADLAAGGLADAGRLAEIHGTSINSIYVSRAKARETLRKQVEQLSRQPAGKRRLP